MGTRLLLFKARNKCVQIFIIGMFWVQYCELMLCDEKERN